jgi:hypothetical protein
MRKAYASQESVEKTLTAAERAAPFQTADADPEPLPKVTRLPVLVEGLTISIVDPKTGAVVPIEETAAA